MTPTGASRELDQTPTWAVALVCAVIVVISIILEKVLHHFGETFEKKKQKALGEALEKIEAELMILGFISLLLTFGQNYIAQICIPDEVANTMLPCHKEHLSMGHHVPPGPGHVPAGHSPSGHETPGHETPDHETPGHEAPGHEAPGHEAPGHEAPGHEKVGGHRRLLWYERRSLAADSEVACHKGFMPLISVHGLHQLHIFIFFLAVFHVVYSAITMSLGRLKIRGWKEWEEKAAHEGATSQDHSKFRLTHETSFVRDHTAFWTKTPLFFYTACFFRQFYRSITRADYVAMRNGFIAVHLASGSKFDFQKYIKRSLEDDFKIVVGISPLLWTSAVIFLLLNVGGWNIVMYVLSLLPLITTLVIGAKLQAIISQMAIDIREHHAVVQGIPLVQASDKHFWFGKPKLILHLIHLTLFQNAFEVTNFIFISYEFGLDSCFHHSFSFALFRCFLGICVQFVCSFITLPLYALVTQMGSNMKRSIFDEQTSKALMIWHKNVKQKGPKDGEPK